MEEPGCGTGRAESADGLSRLVKVEVEDEATEKNLNEEGEYSSRPHKILKIERGCDQRGEEDAHDRGVQLWTIDGGYFNLERDANLLISKPEEITGGGDDHENREMTMPAKEGSDCFDEKEEEVALDMQLLPERIAWRDEIIRANERLVCINWTTLDRQFAEVVGAHLHKHLPRTRVALPIRFSIPTWELLRDILQHHNGKCLRLDAEEQVQHFLGKWSRKTFPRGSYALVLPPLLISFDSTKPRVDVSFYCAVYNSRHTKQWPMKYTLLKYVLR